MRAKKAIYDHFTPAVTIQSPIIVYSFTVVCEKKGIQGRTQRRRLQSLLLRSISHQRHAMPWRNRPSKYWHKVQFGCEIGHAFFFRQRMLVSNALVFWVCFENSFIWCIICCCYCCRLICLGGGLLLKLTCNNLDVKYEFLCDVSIVSGLFMTWRVFGCSRRLWRSGSLVAFPFGKDFFFRPERVLLEVSINKFSMY